ncbi:glycosyltransferase family 87 protein [Mucilaginibacter sp. PAMB04168]|uniref:glycosyltransferase family 87 protein n=1 Tax=Mucilaginibacter sp. PAMB04168 TaxID=3138567 RepID=UPI0031F60C69
MIKRLNLTNSYKPVVFLWLAVSIFCWQYKYFNNRYNNYSIFDGVYHHTVAQTNLYAPYPAEYYDTNHYGPFFSLVVAPFAVLPTGLGFFLWNLMNAGVLIWAVTLLPLANKRKILLLLLCSIEFANTQHSIQFNPVIAAFLIFSFYFLEKKREEWATLFIVIGALIKLYPIIGLAFFMFSKRKGAFALWCVIWAIVGVCLPMLISSPHFILQSHLDWYHSLSDKNIVNIGLNSAQDLSVMGVVRRITSNLTIPNIPFLAVGAITLGLAVLRVKQFSYQSFKLQVLALCLMIVVLFSTGSEPPTYIIAIIGAMIYLLAQQSPFSNGNLAFIILIALLAGLASTDAIPAFIRKPYVSRYAMKVWPYIALWAKMVYELLMSDFGNKEKQLKAANILHPIGTPEQPLQTAS